MDKIFNITFILSPFAMLLCVFSLNNLFKKIYVEVSNSNMDENVKEIVRKYLEKSLIFVIILLAISLSTIVFKSYHN